jgi:hypothetical protein
MCLALRWGAQLADVQTGPCVCVADVSWGAQLADMPCMRCALNLQTCLALRWGTQLADVTCVAFGRPSCGRVFRCVRASNLGEAVLKSIPPSQNLFLSILQLVF